MRFPDGKGTYFAHGINAERLSLAGTDILEATGTVLEVSAAVNVAKGQLVYISGYNATQGILQVKLADADATAPANVALFVAPAAIAINTVGKVQSTFLLTGVNTSGVTTVGDPVFLSTTAGGWATAAPTGGGHTVQMVGAVTVKSATVGEVFLFPALTKATTVNTTT